MSSRPVFKNGSLDKVEATRSQKVAMDGHVHLQSDMPWDLIASNFSSHAPDHVPVCLIVESAGIDRFAELQMTCDPWGATGLKDTATGLHFVAGRQVVSEEGLEILLIGSRDQSGEGQPADRVIGAGFDRGAAVCLPWGFGKWLGKRRVLAGDIHKRLSSQVILGDITNRPLHWHEPMFAGQRVLRGADNLPLPGSSDIVGTFGSIIEPKEEVTTADQLVALLRDTAIMLEPYGKRKTARASVFEQIRLRLNRGGG
ncbi:hypothetical protein [Altererythrobacter sp. GH1-8]|uniref:hypothetical protein n=1 Tax=Altererythrobacter sp. GH1-8 TaxID=3349333 RepID=UPI00374D9972